MVEALRSCSDAARLGLVSANGGVLTEESVGIYSLQPPAMPYTRRDPAAYAPAVGLPPSSLAKAPRGSGTVLTFTVVYHATRDLLNTPSHVVAIGELSSGADTGKRFVAKSAPGDAATIARALGARGIISERVLVSTARGEDENDDEEQEEQEGSDGAAGASIAMVLLDSTATETRVREATFTMGEARL